MNKKDYIKQTYISLSTMLGRKPTMLELEEYSREKATEDQATWYITRDKIKHHFHSLSYLDGICAHELNQGDFDTSLPKKNESTNVRAPEYKSPRYVITSLISNSDIDLDFLKILRLFCEVNKALLKIILLPDAKGKINEKAWSSYYPLIHPDEILDEDDFEIAPDFKVSSLKLSIKTTEPLNIVQHLKSKDSLVIGSPKLRLRTMSYWDKPFYTMTTGTLSLCDYLKPSISSPRDLMAAMDHTNGAIFLERIGNKVSFRQLQYVDNSITDYGLVYTKDKVLPSSPEAIVLGDWHSGSTSEYIANLSLEVIKTLKPKSVILHDLFDGASINHHEEGKVLTKANRHNHSQTNLEQELTKVYKDLLVLSEHAHLVVVRSNHDLFLDQYLDEGKFIQDYENITYASTLVHYKVRKQNILEKAIRDISTRYPENKGLKNVTWLSKLDSFKVGDIELGHHGNSGVNGSRATLNALEKLYDKAVVGHFHSSYIGKGVWAVGTSTDLRISYNDSGSTWSHSLILVYANGTRQLINL